MSRLFAYPLGIVIPLLLAAFGFLLSGLTIGDYLGGFLLGVGITILYKRG